jgi:23S rRNA (cytidine2498-2'-O)-methyltransferase
MTHAILTCSEHFTDLALNELQRQHPNVTLVQQVSPQHLFLKAPLSFDHLTRPWRNQLPIYLHHLFPVHHTLPLTGTPTDFDCLRRQAQALCRKDYQVQARIVGDYPYSAITLEQVIRPGQPASSITKPNGRVLSLVVVDKCVYMGISWASQNLSAFATGRPYFDEPLPNRAGFKLLEALDAFDIRLRPGDHALDLGAAPGAWTAVLVRRGMRVTAVAPSAMYDWLQVESNVRAVCTTAEEYLPSCDTTYDLIVNDMKLDAQDSARLMAQYAAHLRPQGIAIMTLKLRLREPRRLMDHAFRLLRKEYKILRVRQLVGNRKEVTLFLRRHN